MNTHKLSQLKLFAVFATVVDSGSFAAAARKLGSSRSRISEQVAQLEQELSVRLLQRSTRQLKLTHEGQQVYQQAVKLTDILNDIDAELDSGEPSGRVAITLNHDVAHQHILPLMDDFKQKYPKIELDLLVDDERLDLIDEQIDLAIRIGIPKDESVIARVLHQESFGLFAHKDLIAKEGMPETIAALEAMSWVLLNQASRGNFIRLERNGQPLDIRPRRLHRCNSPLLAQQMVIKGLGVCALFRSSLQNEIDAGNVVQLMPDISSEDYAFSLVYPSRKQVPPRTRAVIDYLLDARMFG